MILTLLNTELNAERTFLNAELSAKILGIAELNAELSAIFLLNAERLILCLNISKAAKIEDFFKESILIYLSFNSLCLMPDKFELNFNYFLGLLTNSYGIWCP